MKKLEPVFVIVFALSLITTHAIAEENLSKSNDWHEVVYEGSAEFKLDRNSLNIFASGNDGTTYAQWEKRVKNPIGMIATVQVTSTSGDGDKFIGIRGNIGTWGNNTFLAEIRLPEWDEKTKCINYRIRERNSENNTVRVWSYGYIGDWSGEWNTDDSIVIGFAKIQNEIWFYADNYNSKKNVKTGNCFVKVQPFPTSIVKNMGSLDEPYFAINTFVDGGGFISGSVENVMIVR